MRWGLTLPEGAEGTPCGEGDTCLDYGVARVVVTVEDHCQKVAWTSGGENGSLAELKDCVLLEGHWWVGYRGGCGCKLELNLSPSTSLFSILTR